MLFLKEETYIPVQWDLSDLKETITKMLEKASEYKHIARNAQNIYKQYLDRKSGIELFIDDFEKNVMD